MDKHIIIKDPKRQSKIRHKKDIPNIEGYQLLAIMPDLTIIPVTVEKSESGIFVVPHFKEMLGWRKETDHLDPLMEICHK